MEFNKRFMALGMILVVAFLVGSLTGAKLSCSEGDLMGFKCMNLNVTNVCEFEGQLYKQNFSSDVFGILNSSADDLNVVTPQNG